MELAVVCSSGSGSAYNSLSFRSEFSNRVGVTWMRLVMDSRTQKKYRQLPLVSLFSICCSNDTMCGDLCFCHPPSLWSATAKDDADCFRRRYMTAHDDSDESDPFVVDVVATPEPCCCSKCACNVCIDTVAHSGSSARRQCFPASSVRKIKSYPQTLFQFGRKSEEKHMHDMIKQRNIILPLQTGNVVHADIRVDESRMMEAPQTWANMHVGEDGWARNLCSVTGASGRRRTDTLTSVATQNGLITRISSPV